MIAMSGRPSNENANQLQALCGSRPQN